MSESCTLRIGLHARAIPAAWAAPAWNLVEGGPFELLSWLETSLGLQADRPPHTDRVLRHAAALAAATDTSFAASLATDRWATATALLAARDELRMAGWDGSDAPGLPRLVRDLARAELEARGSTAGEADRLAAITAALDDGQPLPAHICQLTEHIAEWPVAWRGVLARIATTRVAPPTPFASQGTLLHGLQQRIHGSARDSALDDSVRWMRARSVATACEALAAMLAAEPAALPTTVICCESPLVAARFDAALARLGLPTVGAALRGAAIPVLQVLPLALELCRTPVDPARLLDLLTLPIGPIPRGAGRRLAEALVRHPGLGSRSWTKAIADLTQVEADPEGRTAAQLRAWLEHDRVPRGQPLPVALINERCQAVAQWAMARAKVEDVDQSPEVRSALEIVAAQARTVRDLASTLGEAITSPQLARLLESASGDGLSACPQPARAEGPVIVSSLAELTWPCDRLVWLGLGTGDVPASRWTRLELAALQAAAVDADDGTRHLRSLRAAERHGLTRVRQRLLAVSLPDDAEARPHPLWLQIHGAWQELAADRLCAVPLETLLRGDAAGDIAPWHLPRRRFSVLPPQPPRPIWLAPPKSLAPSATVSATSLQQQLTCPLAWTLTSQARLRSSPIARLPDDYRLKGELSHRVLEDVFGTGEHLSVEQARARVAARFDECVVLDAAPLAQPARTADRQQLRAELIAASEVLVRALEAGGYRVAAMEAPLDSEVSGRALRGSADCVVVRDDGEHAIIDFKYGGSTKHPKRLAEGRAFQLATYAAARAAQSGQRDVRVAYVIISRALLATPAGGALRGATGPQVVAGAPSVLATWESLVAALDSSNGWLRAEGPVPAIPLQSLDQRSPAVAALLSDELLEETCRYCDFGVLCGKEPRA